MPSYRLKFSGSSGRPAHNSVLIGLGVDKAAFRTAFRPFGFVR